jgi:hypothetical protein
MKISQDQMKTLNLQPHQQNPEWNYSLLPRAAQLNIFNSKCYFAANPKRRPDLLTLSYWTFSPWAPTAERWNWIPPEIPRSG